MNLAHSETYFTVEQRNFQVVQCEKSSMIERCAMWMNKIIFTLNYLAPSGAFLTSYVVPQ